MLILGNEPILSLTPSSPQSMNLEAFIGTIKEITRTVMIKAIMLPTGRWQLELNGVKGPTAPYEGPAFWPTQESPELIGCTDYYGSANVWRIHSVCNAITDVEWVDATLE